MDPNGAAPMVTAPEDNKPGLAAHPHRNQVANRRLP